MEGSSNHSPTIDARCARRLRLLIYGALALLLTGLSAPVISLEKFFILSNTVSIVGGAVQLVDEGKWFLFLIVFLFSILLPALKLFLLLLVLSPESGQGESMKRYLRWMHHYGRWAMLDVFVIAVLVVSVKLGAAMAVELQPGFYAFALAILITMGVTTRITGLLERRAATPSGG